MDLVRFDPFSLLSEMDRLFERGATAAPTWAPRLDAFDREKELVIRVELPGVKPEDVDITVEDRTLTISGKRQFEETVEQGNYHRREIFTGEFKRIATVPGGWGAPCYTGDDTATHIAITGDVTLTVGELATVSIILQQKENVLWLPPAAIRTYQGRNFCVVQNADGTQKRVDVLLGITTDERVEIVSGLGQGQTIVGE